MSDLLQNARYALRQLRKNPGFTTVGVIMLGLGIGANTAIFSVVDSVLLRPLPFHDPSRSVAIKTTEPGRRDDIIAFPVLLIGGRAVASQLYGVKGYDPRILFAAVAVFTLSASGAAVVPARRAMEVDPMVALRYE